MKCPCGGDAALRTVNKDGPNKGRQFYTCSNRENSCKFFKWAEKEESSTTTPKTTPPKKSPIKEPIDDVEDVKCKCGEAKLQRVNKEGANNGRYFWSCPNKDDSCKFFLWCDHPEKYLKKVLNIHYSNSKSKKIKNQPWKRKSQV
jgi:DNA topoisomerase-3